MVRLQAEHEITRVAPRWVQLRRRTRFTSTSGPASPSVETIALGVMLDSPWWSATCGGRASAGMPDQTERADLLR